ncbi:MAG: imelysin family protein, partial [Bacteroidota bacterium]
PQKVQAPYSNESLALTMASVEVIEEVFFGNNHPNISEYISSLAEDEVVNGRIKTAIQDIKEAIAAIPVPLEEAVDTYPKEVENLHLQLTALNIWMGVDARSLLSVILTSTDNDGD